MTTNELICELRDWAEVEGPGSMAAIMSEAADCIEALDERVSIMEVECGAEQANIRVNGEGLREKVIKGGLDGCVVS